MTSGYDPQAHSARSIKIATGQQPTRRAFLQQGTAAAAVLAVSPHRLLADTIKPQATQQTIVSTPHGRLRGEVANSIRIFRGIPFAQPPIGPLRFRPPAPPQRWHGVRDATRFAPAAMQPRDPGVQHSEDCLYLNLWAPSGPGPFPVFVWIHGGGYTGGRSSAPIFDGTVFARQDMVVVTVAYRLGVFGFLDLEPLLGPSYADSANNAMRDLVASLEWVHHNIAAFGGDPTRVTVGGESAGAKATAALMAIPQSRDFFHSAISESGGGERVSNLAQATAVAEAYGKLWSSQQPGSSHTPKSLLTAPPEALIATQTRLLAGYPFHFPLRPEYGGSYLPKRPVDLVAAGSSAGKRLLIGTNRDENALFLGAHPSSDPTAKDLGNLDLTRFDQVLPEYTKLYPQMSPAQRRIEAVTAEEYWVPSVRLASAQAANGGPTWMYRLDYTKPSGRMANEAYHSLDLGLIWNNLDAVEAQDAAAVTLSRQMHEAWVSFIHGETPAAAGLPHWSEYHPETRTTMILSATPHLEQRPSEAELELWKHLL